jgi:coproporphyrinogen III oxidase-like Fe-S oxidoreductase
LPVDAMRRLLVGLRARFDFSAVDEWTIEVNPATAELDYCRMLRDHGVTRLSFGAQSFDPAELKMLERHHDPDDVERSVELARRAGFERLNVDLIFAVPGQTVESWDRSLSRALAMRTPHVSCYALTYEPNTPLAVKKRLGQVKAVDESLELEMLAHTRRRLAAAGYQAYEISNFAVAGEACRHNLLYWDGGSYVGLGPSAASHAHGIVYSDFASRWPGRDARRVFADPLDRYARAGLLASDGRGVRLTERGVAVADAIAAEFLAAASTASTAPAAAASQNAPSPADAVAVGPRVTALTR